MNAPVLAASAAYRPPAPARRSEVAVLTRALLFGKRDLLSLFPAEAYSVRMAKVPIGRRRIWIVNDPETIRTVLVDRAESYPKSDLMVSALRPLVGDGIFISNGDIWRRQRAMIEPAFAHMRMAAAYPRMMGAVTQFVDEISAGAGVIELDAAMSRVTADAIYRTIFTEPLASDEARSVFDAFQRYQDVVPQVTPRTVLWTAPDKDFGVDPEVDKACRAIRGVLGRIIDRRLAQGGDSDDLAGAMISARDRETGAGFDRDELIDQIAVFFLAGHETSASVLAWAMYILTQVPEVAERVRREVEAIAGDGAITSQHVGRMTFTRAVFRETMRLYPPVAVISRIARAKDELRGYAIEPGDLMVISPWLIQRHEKFWEEPELFRPERFLPENEKSIAANTYLPFGVGPRVCTGSGFAHTEAVLILAELTRRFRFETLEPEKVRPALRVTVRPESAIRVRVMRRDG